MSGSISWSRIINCTQLRKYGPLLKFFEFVYKDVSNAPSKQVKSRLQGIFLSVNGPYLFLSGPRSFSFLKKSGCRVLFSLKT